MGEFEIDASFEPRGGKWRSTLAEAIKADYEGKKDPQKDDQYFEVTIYVRAENPVREYRAVLSEVPEPPAS